MASPYEQTLDLTGLHPRLAAYFSQIPRGRIGRGVGSFDAVGTPRRWLWPVLWVLGRQGVVFPFWGRDVPFTVTNTPTDAGLAATRTFQFPRGPRAMTDLMTLRQGRLHDELGHARRYRAVLDGCVVDGALHLWSTSMSLRLGALSVPLPGRVALTERWDDRTSRQHVSVVITMAVVGRVYEYSGYFTYGVGS